VSGSSGPAKTKRVTRIAPGLPAVLILALLSAGCGRGSAGAPPPAATAEAQATVRESPQASSADEQAVLAAYQGYWQALLAANNPPDEFHPALRQYATGAALESVVNAARANRAARQAVRLPPDSVYAHRAEVVSIQGDTATVRDCAIDDGVVVNLDNGAVVNDEVMTRLATADLVREQGTWKVSYTKVEQTWKGVAGCAEQQPS
jgi:hypothetical protein